jgi:hypothetical protein
MDFDNPITDLIVTEEFPNCVNVEYTIPKRKIEASNLNDEQKKAFSSTINLLFINGQDDFITLFPINTIPHYSDFLKKKYNKIESITLEGFGFTTPETAEDVIYLLEELPSGFTKDYEYGLGLLKDYRFIIKMIEEIPNIKHLVISKKNKSPFGQIKSQHEYLNSLALDGTQFYNFLYGKEKNSIDNNYFILNYSEFEIIRKGINRIAKYYQGESKTEKIIFSYNSILNKLDPSTYPEMLKPYKKDVIYRLVSGMSHSESSISRSDTDAVIDLISSNKRRAYNNNKKKVIQLQHDIDLLNLEWLVDKADQLLKKKSSENDWQILLNENPYILSLLFGYPILKIQGQASIGGRRITGSGGKITDFIVKNNLTNNAALVEIKKPSTPLLKNSEYRTGVYSLSIELSGSIGQLLDQKYKFQKEIAIIKDNSGVYDIESYSVDCVLIIGTIPEVKEQKKSFELFRHNLKDIKIVTFDELLTKLNDVFWALKPKVGVQE